MRQKVVWFILGVLVGSLFVVSAYPTNGKAQYSVPAIQRISGQNYTTYLLYPKNGLPLSPEFLKRTIPKLVEKSASNTKWHVYAVPELPKGSVITGYGIKVAKDGRIDILITATNRNTPILPDKIRSELLEWSKKAPKFKPDVIPKEKIGVPKGWKVKTVDSNGNVRVYSGESEPYWHDFGPVTIHYENPPYGNVYATFHVYSLWNDNDPNWEYFLVAPGKDEYGRGLPTDFYEIDPGYGLKVYRGDNDYGEYVTKSARILHEWDLESALNPKLISAAPINTDINHGHETIQASIGYPVLALTFTSTIPDSQMHSAADRYHPGAAWVLEFNTHSNDARESFQTNVASEGSVSQSVLHNGQWHAIVNVQFKATFQDPAGWIVKDTSTGVTWYVKVG